MIGSNLKTALVADIEGFNRADRDRIGYAIAAGEKLALAKEDLKHGEWIPFLAEIGLPARTASRWMSIRDLDQDQVKELGSIARAAEVANLTPAQIKRRYVENCRTVVRRMGEIVDSYKRMTADAAETSDMASVAYHALARERGLTDEQIAADIAEVEAELEAEGFVKP